MKFSAKENLYESVSREGVTKRKSRASRSYQKRYEGYTAYQIPKENGKGVKILQIYTGEYYQAVPKHGNWLTLRVMYVLLFVLGAALFVDSTLRICSQCENAVIFLLEIGTCWLLCWHLLTLIEYCAAGKRETQSEYRTSGGICRKSLCCMLGIGSHGIVGLVSLFLTGYGNGWLLPMIFTVETAVAVLTMAVIYLTEKGLKYDCFPSDAVIPKGAQEIRRAGVE